MGRLAPLRGAAERYSCPLVKGDPLRALPERPTDRNHRKRLIRPKQPGVYFCHACFGGAHMSDIRMTTEMRTDYDCETTGLPAERWGEAVFTVGDQEIAIEVSVEQDVIVAVMALSLIHI